MTSTSPAATFAAHPNTTRALARLELTRIHPVAELASVAIGSLDAPTLSRLAAIIVAKTEISEDLFAELFVRVSAGQISATICREARAPWRLFSVAARAMPVSLTDTVAA